MTDEQLTASLLAKGATQLMMHTLAKLAAATAISAVVLTAGATAFLPGYAPPAPLTHAIAAPATLPADPIARATPSIRILPNDPTPTVTVTDLSTHQPLSDVTVEIHADHNGVPYFDPPCTTALTGPDGTAHPAYPPTTANAIHLRATKPG